MNVRRRISHEEIEAAKTPAGGWTKDQLAKWGVSWPPKKHWKRNLVKYGIKKRSKKP